MWTCVRNRTTYAAERIATSHAGLGKYKAPEHGHASTGVRSKSCLEWQLQGCCPQKCCALLFQTETAGARCSEKEVRRATLLHNLNTIPNTNFETPFQTPKLGCTGNVPEFPTGQFASQSKRAKNFEKALNGDLITRSLARVAARRRPTCPHCPSRSSTE